MEEARQKIRRFTCLFKKKKKSYIEDVEIKNQNHPQEALGDIEERDLSLAPGNLQCSS